MPPDVIPMEPALPLAYLLPIILSSIPDVPKKAHIALEGFISDPSIARAIGAFDPEGPGLMPTAGQNNGWNLMRVSHQANKEVHYDPTTDRIEDLLLATNLTLTKGAWAPGVQPTALSLGTSDPRWWSMRDLWSAAVPALQRFPSHVADLQFPPFAGLTKGAFCSELKGWTMFWGGVC